jgi:hypothetical protein
MTLTANDAWVQYTATPAQDEFDYDFEIQAAADLVVRQTVDATGVTSTLTFPTDYTVDDVGEAAGGTVTLVVGAAEDDVLTLYRDTAAARSTDFATKGAFPAATLNGQLDDLTAMVQELARDRDRAPLLPTEAVALTSNKLPTPTATALTILMSASGFTAGPSTATIEAAAAEAAAAAVSAAEAAASAVTAAAAAAAMQGTSTTSVAIGTGAKVFTTQAGKQFDAGAWLLITDDAAPSTNYMHGSVTSYSSTTLTMNITNVGGSGTKTAWTIDVAGTRGATGATGPAGPGSMDNLVDDTSPQLGGFLDPNDQYIGMQKGGDIASAAPLVVDTDGDYFDVTGTTGFAVMTVDADRHFFLQFDGALVMTHHATNLDLPGEANITTAAGDVGEFFSTGANTVQCVAYTKADGTAVVVAKVSQVIAIAASDETTAVAAETDVATFRMPFAFTVTGVRASLTTAQSSGNIFTVDIHESGTTILSTKITIDNTEKTSTTAATPAVVSDAALADDAEITIDIDQIGAAADAAGLKVYLIGYPT